MNAARPPSIDSNATPLRRPACGRCLRAQAGCICQWVRPVANDVHVLILQHPMEVHEAKGSGRLLHLSLPNSRLVVGEVFEEGELFKGDDGARRNILLYPPADAQAGALPGASLPVPDLQPPAGLRLIVLDATWRKSRKMLHLSPWLQRLPRLPLGELPPSRYLIRQAHRPGQLSTLEATCVALEQLRAGPPGDTPAEAAFTPLLAAFDGFVAQQLAFSRGPVSRPGQ